MHFLEQDCLWYQKEAVCFEEALPLGNGKLGAMVYGGVRHARIGLNHDELWTGVPGDGLNGVDKSAYLEAQKLALDGKFKEAQDVLEAKFCKCARVAAYQPLGDVYLDMRAEVVENYRRALFLREGLATEEFVADGVRVTRESLVSYADHCLAWRVSVSEARDFTLSMTAPLGTDCAVDGNEITVRGVAPTFSPVQNTRNARDTAVKDAHGMRFCMRCAVVTDGECVGADGVIAIRGAKEIFVYLTAETSFAGANKHPVREGKDECALSRAALDAALARGYGAIRDAHIADVSRLYDRVYFSVGDGGCAALPTDERLARFDAGRGGADPGLYALMFNYGRYLTIAGSREGSRAMNLQGIWNDKVDPPWSSNYTVNINTEMNYYGTLAVNLPEMTEPLDSLIAAIAENGKKTAEVLYGARGFVCHHNSDVWAHTVPIEGLAVYSYWPFGSGWLCRHLMEKYEYLQDRDYLARVYPILRDAARFYLDILTDVDGYRAVCPSTSPENYFVVGDARVATAKSTAMGMAIVRETLENCARAAEILGISDDVCAEIEQELPRLMPLRILPDGRLEEWYWGDGIEYPEHEPHHRHTSQLYALHPARQITEKTPDLMAAARKTLEARGDDGTGWSLAWKINFFARLCDGDHALKLMKMQLKLVAPAAEKNMHNGGGTYPNLFDAHPPFQIDGNFGFVSGVCEMLVRCDGDEIVPLPALPAEWRNGEVRGLRVKGNRLVDLKWTNGELTDMKVYDA
ncbi:MAG: glycoside hydrolase family 95 protein [Clostridia bacterium]|nr:glycoside hydrolase family 95 protein [Clostridia bacterium]